MPVRLVRDWTDSDRFDGLSPEGERLFMRLLMKADDYGRFHSESRRVKAACFPLLPNLRETEVARWLKELADHQLILLYEVGGRSLLAIPRFGQRLKQSRPKFAPPDGKPPDWLPDPIDFPELPGTSRNIRPDAEAHSETDIFVPQKRSGPCSDSFEAFWQAYPRIGRDRTSKGETWAVWKKNALDSQYGAVMAGLERWKHSEAWTKDGGEFIKNPATFLRKCWFNDFPTQASVNGEDIFASKPRTREEIAAIRGSDD